MRPAPVLGAGPPREEDTVAVDAATLRDADLPTLRALLDRLGLTSADMRTRSQALTKLTAQAVGFTPRP